MVRCNVMAWTDKTEGLLKVLVTRRDPVAGTTAVTTTWTHVLPPLPLTPLASAKGMR
jgi:hypothetical protein